MEAIFHRAAELKPEERLAYVQTECAGDNALQAEIEAMLAQDTSADALFGTDLSCVRQALLDSALMPPAGAFGPYRIKSLLGRGGMGVVYLAEREDFGGLVAIKLLAGSPFSPERRQRFLREQRILARLNYPLIAKIYDADVLDDGTPWFAMEYVQGVCITDYCREHGCAIGERLRFFRMACEAVQYAHSKTIIHCDLKPSNILVNSEGSVKLLDFGIAKQLETDDGAEVTRSQMRPLTLANAAPEQLRGESVGTQVDVYALGVLLYELLAGQQPYDLSHRSQTEAEKIVLEGTSAPPSQSVALSPDDGLRKEWAQVPKTNRADLDVLTLSAMNRMPERRYRSVEALLRDVDHFTSGEPLEARPDSVGYRAGKFVKRNRTALASSAAVLALVAALVTFFVARLASAHNAALAEAKRTQRIERFTLDLFDAGDKAAGPAGSLRAVQLLDRGVQSARSLNAEPAIQADLFATLGAVYQKLGEFDQADSLLQSALQRRTAISGANSPAVTESIVSLATLRQDQGKLADAEKLAKRGLAMAKAYLPQGDPAIGRAGTALGHVLEERGAYDDALKVLNDAVRLESTGPPTPDLAEATTLLGVAHYYLGHLDVASALYHRSLALDSQLYGALHPAVADNYFNIGVVQHDLGHDHDAEQAYRKALEIKQSWYGTEHPDTAIFMAAVGQSLIYQGRFNEAAPILIQALAIQERILGKTHPQVAMGLNTLGTLEIKRGHLDEAEADFKRMAEINRAVYGDRHYLVGVALLNLSQVAAARKNYPSAERYCREALARLMQTLPPGHVNIAIAQNRLGHLLVLEKRYPEAESPLTEAYKVLEKQPEGQAALLQSARKDIAAVSDALHKPDAVSTSASSRR